MCNNCKKLFSEKDVLIKHIIVHTKVKLFKCDICNKSFSEKDVFIKYMVVHTNITNYKPRPM